MKVLITASECAPLVKVGGIADVIGSLPIVLLAQAIDVRVAIPFYKPLGEKIEKEPHTPAPAKILETKVMYAGKEQHVDVYLSYIPHTPVIVYLIDNKDLISNGGIYFSPETMPSPESELERFAFFSKCIADIFAKPNQVFEPEIIHCNDWHTGMVPQLIQNTARFVGTPPVKTIFTIHNLAYQGFTRIEVAEKLGLDISKDKTLSWDAADDNLDFILQGIAGADYVNTVSERYAQEIQTPEYGEGLNEILKARQGRLSGILNGISYEIFNPETDAFLPFKYGLTSWKNGKAQNKAALQQQLGIEVNPHKPMLGIISRLAHQKGLDFVAESVPQIIEMGYQIVVLGTGDPFIEAKFNEYNQSNLNQNFKAVIAFSEETARRIYAASDMFLVPSRFEPCGLTQMIAMRYGAVPVVRATGGLFDTVRNNDNGFTFEELSVTAMLTALKAAVTEFSARTSNWDRLVTSCMTKDFSWKESAKKYIALYSKVLAGQQTTN